MDMNRFAASIDSFLQGLGTLKIDKSYKDYPLLDEKRKLRPMPAVFWYGLGFSARRYFMHVHSQYFLPTVESLVMLQKIIGQTPREHCLEIGAGNGWLGHLLGIRMTDSHLQEREDIKRNYSSIMQPTIQYGKDVERLDALSAVKKYRPHTVVASWVSEFNEPPLGNPDGIREVEMMNHIRRYIFIGTDSQHGHKQIMKAFPGQQYRVHGLLSRSRNDQENAIWVFEK